MTTVHYVYFCSNEITQEKLTILATIGKALKHPYASKKWARIQFTYLEDRILLCNHSNLAGHFVSHRPNPPETIVKSYLLRVWDETHTVSSDKVNPETERWRLGEIWMKGLSESWSEVDSGLLAALITHILISGLWFLVYNSQCFSWKKSASQHTSTEEKKKVWLKKDVMSAPWGPCVQRGPA